ncbi:MAG: ornithine carbamoyltransferase [Phycisphaeraceae bacterium]|nr:MAG: ornithine carbamoyltransferase [Phycisphaeraceae bacterium]
MIYPSNTLTSNNLLGMTQLSTDDIASIFHTAAHMKKSPKDHRAALDGKAVMLLFEKPSLRTRVSFEVGGAKLGASVVYMDHGSSRIGEREAVKDYARNLERWCDLIVARTFSHTTIEELARHTDIPVINGLSDLEHPCQALADFFTLSEVFGELKGMKIAYIGDGNNVCHSLMLGAAKLGMDLMIIAPEGYEPAPEIVSHSLRLARATGAELTITDEIEAVHGRRAVYTDTWVSMGDEREAGPRRAAFAEHQVNEVVMAMAAPDAVFMHCLPAHRGAEVTDAVIDSPQSVVYDQAENRMHVQNAVMAHLLGAASLAGAAETYENVEVKSAKRRVEAA